MLRDRRGFLAALGTALLSAPLAADTLYAAAGPRVAVFFSGSPASRFEETSGRTFLDALRSVGWVDGHNITVEWHYSEDNDERRRTLAEDFVRRKLDVIVVQSTPEALAIKRTTATIPHRLWNSRRKISFRHYMADLRSPRPAVS